MIKIKKVEEHLGSGVFTMECSCNDAPFLVNTRPEVPVHFNPTTNMVRCPYGCGVEVSLMIILENEARNQGIDHFMGQVKKAWGQDETKEEQK